MTRLSRLSSAAALAAAFSMATTPAIAADLPAPSAQAAAPGFAVWDADSENAQRDRYRGRYRNNRVDAGDVIGGLLVIGAIAAVANAVSKPRQRSYPSTYPNRPYDYRESRGDSRYNGGQGIDRAADMCVREIERDVRVNGVDTVERSGDGWRVSGSLYNGDGFTCRIGSDGRVEDVTYGRGDNSRADNSQGDNDRQYGDDRYASAWANVGNAEPDTPYRAAPVQSGAAPAYPGGPVPGDEGYADDDGRYSTSDAPDFSG